MSEQNWDGEELKKLTVEVALLTERLEHLTMSLNKTIDRLNNTVTEDRNRLTDVEKSIAKHDVWITLLSVVIIALLTYAISQGLNP